MQSLDAPAEIRVPAPKIAQALKDTFQISCSRTSGRERSYFRLSCCSSIRREVQAAASWSPGQNRARRFETLLSQSLSYVLLALPHFSEDFSHVLLPVLFTPHHSNNKTSLDKSRIPVVTVSNTDPPGSSQEKHTHCFEQLNLLGWEFMGLCQALPQDTLSHPLLTLCSRATWQEACTPQYLLSSLHSPAHSPAQAESTFPICASTCPVPTLHTPNHHPGLSWGQSLHLAGLFCTHKMHLFRPHILSYWSPKWLGSAC